MAPTDSRSQDSCNLGMELPVLTHRQMSYSLNFLKGGSIGDCLGQHYGAY